jgi:CheY-like chemotaxis protein
VTYVFDTLEAIRKSKDSFDLVITDYAMPQMTGVELAQEIRRMGFNMPIILCTGNNEQIALEKVRGSGITELAAKPLNKKEFSHIVQKTINRTKTTDGCRG